VASRRILNKINDTDVNEKETKKPRGRPRRWIDSVNEIRMPIAQEGGIDWQVITYDREKWEEILNRLQCREK